MKYIIFHIIFTICLYADIDAQIDKIKKAPIDKRFVLMNQFKKKMVKMREDERYEAMKKLRKIINNQENNSTEDTKDRVKKELGLDEVDSDRIEEIGQREGK